MAVKNNPITFYTNDGWWITSNPNNYYQSYNPNRGKKAWGQRDHSEYGINVDSYCNGMHRAYDLGKYHNAPIKSFANATVLNGTGWNTFGWTLVLGFIDAKGKKWQVIYGHLNRNPLLDFKIGQNVKKGQVVAYQGTSNNLGVSMASHLHIQFQEYQALNEWNFTCLGWNPLNIDISSTKPTSGTVATASKPASKPKATAKKETPATFNKFKGRKTRNNAYAKGIVRNSDGLGAAQYRWSGGNFTNRFWPDIREGEEVWIFATSASGWGKVYSPNHKGWVYLPRVQITHVF